MRAKIFGIIISLLLLIAWAYPAAAEEGNPGKIVRPVKPGVLEVVFIHYEKPDNPGKGKPTPTPTPEPKDNYYYEPIGPKWFLKNPNGTLKYPGGIPFTINPSGAPLGAAAEVAEAFDAWDAATGAELFFDTLTVATDKWWGMLDGRNNVSWQFIAGAPNAIAATWIWVDDNDNSGTLSPGDEVLENDIVFNTYKKITWGIDPDGEGGVTISTFDVCNIATHEIGHVVGLDDLYASQYSELTMYGYGSKGETKKISLEAGDIAGAIAATTP